MTKEREREEKMYFEIQIVIGYLVAVGCAKVYMKNREPLRLMVLTAVHNEFLCFASAMMTIGLAFELEMLIKTRGLHAAFCNKDFRKPVDTWALDYNARDLGFWMYMYYFSKFYELVDTFLIVFKKKPLIFLHVYHHAIAILIVGSWIDYSIYYGYFGSIINTAIHIVMYYYYAISNQGYRPNWKRYIADAQIIQFFTDIALSLPVLYYTFTESTPRSWGCAGVGIYSFGLAVIITFIFLFMQFRTATYPARYKNPVN